MPSRHLVRLDPGDGLESVMPWHLHALACAWIEAGGPGHHSKAKPFTVSPLRDVGDGGWGFEISLLDDGLEGRLVDAVAAATRGVRLGARHSRTLPFPEGPLRVLDRSRWEALATEARDVRAFGFDFLTPTAFRHRRTAVPLPIPSLIFGHFRARWEEFAPKHLAPRIGFDELNLRVDHLRVETARLPGRYHNHLGFVGEVRLSAGRGSAEERRWLDRLAAVAPYAGTGSGTTIGMGVTRYTPAGPVSVAELSGVSRQRSRTRSAR